MQHSTILDDLFEKARNASIEGNEDEAIAIYNNILDQKEDWATAHYNLGLIYKYRREWGKSYRHNKRAVELNPDNEAGRWNLGIAATMVGEWKLARECWNRFGMKYEIIDKDTAYEQVIGDACIRIEPNEKGETVWATRICPTRAVLKSIPLPESEHNFKDIVLNDGAPNGKRLAGGIEYPVLDEIQHLVVSEYRTYSVKINSLNDSHLLDLRNRCHASDIAVENWSTEITYLCKQCSEGTPHEKHDTDLENTPKDQTVAFASTSLEKLQGILEKWADETGADYCDFYYYHDDDVV